MWRDSPILNDRKQRIVDGLAQDTARLGRLDRHSLRRVRSTVNSAFQNQWLDLVAQEAFQR